MTTKHAKTPWHIGKVNSRTRNTEIKSDNRFRIAYVYSSNIIKECEESVANAAFIVRAVNNHAELVRLLSSILEEIDVTKTLGGQFENDMIVALAKAKGEPS